MELIGFSAFAILLLENLKKTEKPQEAIGAPFIRPNDPYDPGADFTTSIPEIYLPDGYVGTTENQKYEIQGLRSKREDMSEIARIKRMDPIKRRKIKKMIQSESIDYYNVLEDDMRQRRRLNEAVRITEKEKIKQYKKIHKK